MTSLSIRKTIKKMQKLIDAGKTRVEAAKLVADKYDMNHLTLITRYRRHGPKGDTHGNSVLNLEQEKQLITVCRALWVKGAPIQTRGIASMVESLWGIKITTRWVRKFLGKHLEVIFAEVTEAEKLELARNGTISNENRNLRFIPETPAMHPNAYRIFSTPESDEEMELITFPAPRSQSNIFSRTQNTNSMRPLNLQQGNVPMTSHAVNVVHQSSDLASMTDIPDQSPLSGQKRKNDQSNLSNDQEQQRRKLDISNKW